MIKCTFWGCSFLLIVYTSFCSLSSCAQTNELELLRHSIYRFIDYDRGKTDSIAKNKENSERLKAELDLAWMNFVLHKNSISLEALKKEGKNNTTSYSIGAHSYFFHEFKRNQLNPSLLNNVNYNITLYGVYDYGLPNFVSIHIQPFIINHKELVAYFYSLNGIGTYQIKDIESNKIIFKSEAITSGNPIQDLFSLDDQHLLIIENMGKNGKRAMVIASNNEVAKPINGFKGKVLTETNNEFKLSEKIVNHKYLWFCEGKYLNGLYGEGFLKQYEINFNDKNKTISYKKYDKEKDGGVLIQADWKNNQFVIDDYYLGKDLNDEPLPFPG